MFSSPDKPKKQTAKNDTTELTDAVAMVLCNRKLLVEAEKLVELEQRHKALDRLCEEIDISDNSVRDSPTMKVAESNREVTTTNHITSVERSNMGSTIHSQMSESRGPNVKTSICNQPTTATEPDSAPRVYNHGITPRRPYTDPKIQVYDMDDSDSKASSMEGPESKGIFTKEPERVKEHAQMIVELQDFPSYDEPLEISLQTEQETIEKMENGDRQLPTYDEATNISKSAGVTMKPRLNLKNIPGAEEMLERLRLTGKVRQWKKTTR